MAKTVDTSSEQYRHACECRDVVRRYWPDMIYAEKYFALVEKLRGFEARVRLQKGVTRVLEKMGRETHHEAAA